MTDEIMNLRTLSAPVTMKLSAPSICFACRQAYACGVSPPGPGQISSSFASVSLGSVSDGALRFWRNCSIVRGPLIAAVTTRLCSTPGERHVRGRLAELLAKRFVSFQLRALLLDSHLQVRRRPPSLGRLAQCAAQ
jgi:hypothetical protein